MTCQSLVGLTLAPRSSLSTTTCLRPQHSQQTISPTKLSFMSLLLCLYPFLFAHFLKISPLNSKIKEMTCKLGNKVRANWAVSSCEFFMSVPLTWLSKMRRGRRAPCWVSVGFNSRVEAVERKRHSGRVQIHAQASKKGTKSCHIPFSTHGTGCSLRSSEVRNLVLQITGHI